MSDRSFMECEDRNPSSIREKMRTRHLKALASLITNNNHTPFQKKGEFFTFSCGFSMSQMKSFYGRTLCRFCSLKEIKLLAVLLKVWEDPEITADINSGRITREEIDTATEKFKWIAGIDRKKRIKNNAYTAIMRLIPSSALKSENIR